jgi:pyruvate carboxylase subunit B
MPGMIVAVKVKVGDKVREGDVVVVLEAMKMQNEIHCPHSGVVKQIMVHDGDLVKSNTVLMVVERDGK